MSKVKYTQEIHDYIASICDGRFNREVADMVNDKFGTDFSYGSIKDYVARNKLRKTKKIYHPPALFSEEMIQFMRDNIKGLKNSEIAKLINDEFGTNFTDNQVKIQKDKYRIRSGYDGRFKKGNTSFTKGKKVEEFLTPEQIEKLKSNQFKKGNIPLNILPVGTIVTNKEGYKVIKIAEPNIWQFYQRYLWEKHYGRKLEENEVVAFLDGDKNNFDINNLQLMTKNESRIMNWRKLRTSDAKLTKAGLQVVRLGMKIKEKEGK